MLSGLAPGPCVLEEYASICRRISLLYEHCNVCNYIPFSLVVGLFTKTCLLRHHIGYWKFIFPKTEGARKKHNLGYSEGRMVLKPFYWSIIHIEMNELESNR